MREMDEEDDGTGKNEHLDRLRAFRPEFWIFPAAGPSALSGSRASEQGS